MLNLYYKFILYICKMLLCLLKIFPVLKLVDLYVYYSSIYFQTFIFILSFKLFLSKLLMLQHYISYSILNLIINIKYLYLLEKYLIIKFISHIFFTKSYPFTSVALPMFVCLFFHIFIIVQYLWLKCYLLL